MVTGRVAMGMEFAELLNEERANWRRSASM